MRIIKDEMAQKFLQAKTTYPYHSPIQALMREHLLSLLLAHHQRIFESIFEFGCGQGEFTQMLCQHLQFDTYICNDINDYGENLKENIQLKIFDMRLLCQQSIFQQKFHLIASNASLQWLPFPQTLQNLQTILYPQGLLLLSSFGVDNLKEIRALCGLGLEYQSLSEIAKILNNCEILALQEECIGVSFNSALEVFRHLKYSGVNSLGQMYLSKQILKRCEDEFHNTLTYHPIYIFAKKIN